MDLTPGSRARDSRSLSAEAAEYGLQANDADAELRQLEKQMKAIQAKAEQARLQKRQAEAARETAFEEEREQRQAAVRDSLTEHHFEGMRKHLGEDQHLINDIKKVAADGAENIGNAAIFVGAMVVRELIGSDDVILVEIARKVLAEPKKAIATAKIGSQQPQNHSTFPKYQFCPKLISSSITPLNSPSRSLRPLRQPSAAPELSFERHPSSQLDTEGGTDKITTEEKFVDQGNKHNAEAKAAPLSIGRGSVGGTNFMARKDDIKDGKETIYTVRTPDVVDLEAEGGTTLVQAHTKENLDPVSDTDFSLNKQGHAKPVEDILEVVPKQELEASIADLAEASKHKRQSTDSISSYDSGNTTTTPGSFRRLSTASAEAEDIFRLPQTPRPATPIPKTYLPGLQALAIQKILPARKKAPGKRKRQDSEATTASEERNITTTPANKKGKKGKDDGAGKFNSPCFSLTPILHVLITSHDVVPPRIATFIKKVKDLSTSAQASALLCSICRQQPVKPRISGCFHMYCEMCWTNQSKGVNAGRKKTEMQCGRQGCEGFLGGAVNVPAELDIMNQNGKVWAGEKSALAKIQIDGAGDLEDDERVEGRCNGG